VYDYLHKLEQAGLISKVGNEAGTAVYTAEGFRLTLTVRETEVSITKIIEVIAQKNEYPAIERVLEDHGIVTSALAYDLVKAHSEAMLQSGKSRASQIYLLERRMTSSKRSIRSSILETTSRPRRRTHR